jgi:integral membrane protein
MPLAPRPADFSRIRGAVKFYQVASIITGTLLLALCAEMLLKYVGGLEIELGGPAGLLALVPAGSTTAVNLSTGILIVHGWFYVVYLFSDFRLWSLMRWPFTRFIIIALGGIIPFLSFFLEGRIAREVRAYLASRETDAAAAGTRPDAPSTTPTVEATQ